MSIRDYDDIAHKAVLIPLIGASLKIRDKWYKVLQTSTHQDTAGHFATYATLQELCGDSDIQAETDPIIVNLDTTDYDY